MTKLTQEQKNAHRQAVKRWKLAHRETYLAARRKVDARRRERRRLDPDLRAKWNEYKNQWRSSLEQREKSRAYASDKRNDPIWVARDRKRANEYRRNNLARCAAYLRTKRSTDPKFRLADNLRRRINAVLRGGIKSASTMKLLGCSTESFKMYFESKFTPNMSWEVFLNGDIHIDHIMPCAVFDLTKPEHQKACFHFSNLQPLWAKDNLIKNAKVLSNQFQLL